MPTAERAPRSTHVARRLWEPLGRWRTQLLWRLHGVCLIAFMLVSYEGVGVDALARFPAWQFHGMTAIGLLLLLLGARLSLIALAAAWALVCFGVLLSEPAESMSFPAAEWTMWLLLPLFSCAMAVIALARQARAPAGPDEMQYRRDVDWGVTRVFRLLAITAMGFAALHKLNADFFDPTVSCISLKGRLTDWWAVPRELYGFIGPAQIVALEMLSGPLSLWAPAVGVLLTIALVATFASIGAPAFAGLIVTMALAFLPDRARAPIAAGMRRAGPVVLIAGGTALIAGRLGYHGELPWMALAVGQALVLFGLLCAGSFAYARARERLARSTAPAPASPAVTGRPALALRAALVIMAALCLFNGLTPYLGLKFQYSFAMLSNLRVDDDRWNSFVFPRAMRLTAHDDYVHVRRARYTRLPSGPSFDRAGVLDPGLYSPTALRERLQRALLRRVQVTLDFDYRGRSYRFVDPSRPGELYAWVSRLPHTPLIQKHLETGVPQRCVH